MERAGVGARHHLVCSLSLFFRESISAQIVLPGSALRPFSQSSSILNFIV